LYMTAERQELVPIRSGANGSKQTARSGLRGGVDRTGGRAQGPEVSLAI
jgi:hypothetical protein